MADEASMMAVTCPACGQRMRVPASAKGKSCKCVKCGERIALDDVAMAPIEAQPSPDAEGANEAPIVAPDRIGQMLVDAGAITPEQRDEALSLQKKKGGKTFELLIEMGYLDNDTLHSVLSRQAGVASIDIKNYEVSEDLLQLVPQEIAEKNLVLPIDRMGKLLTIGMACPLDTDTITRIQELTGLRVKAMLCRLDDISAAVRRYYGKEAGADDKDYFKFLTSTAASGKKVDLQPKLEALAPLPAGADVVKVVVKQAQDPNASLRELVDGISTDPALAAWVLSVGNSAAYGLSQQVVSVALAATLMGKDAVGRIAARLDTMDPASNGAAIPREAFRVRAMFCSIAAHQLAKLSGRGRPSAASSAGLLHELGRLALNAVSKEKYQKVDPALTGMDLVQAEEKLLGMGHPEAGYIVATSWGLPPSVTGPMRYYLRPEKADEDAWDSTQVVALAHLLALAGVPDGPLSEESAFTRAAEPMAALGLERRAVASVLAKTKVAVNARM